MKKQYILIISVVVCALLAYVLWPSKKATPTSNVERVEKREERTPVLSAPDPMPKPQMPSPIPESMPERLTEPMPENSPPAEPQKPIEESDAEKDFVAHQEQLQGLMEELAMLMDEFQTQMQTDPDGEESSFLQEDMHEVARLISERMKQAGMTELSVNGWNFYVNPDGSYDYGLSEL